MSNIARKSLNVLGNLIKVNEQDNKPTGLQKSVSFDPDANDDPLLEIKRQADEKREGMRKE